jgi:hypothetical protein
MELYAVYSRYCCSLFIFMKDEHTCSVALMWRLLCQVQPSHHTCVACSLPYATMLLDTAKTAVSPSLLKLVAQLFHSFTDAAL